MKTKCSIYARVKYKLDQLGLSVLRFRDIDIRKNMSGVICQIEKWIEDFENKTTS